MFDERIKRIKHQIRLQNLTNPKQPPHIKAAFTPDQMYNPAAMAGNMPVPPGSVPVDPSVMAGGAPPPMMDPTMMGAAPAPGMGPAMMGPNMPQPMPTGPSGAPIGLTPDALAMMAQMSGGVPLEEESEEKSKKSKSNQQDILTELKIIKRLLVAILRHLGEPVVGVDEVLGEEPVGEVPEDLSEDNRIRSELLKELIQKSQQAQSPENVPPGQAAPAIVGQQ